jgi:hypothetical protein
MPPFRSYGDGDGHTGLSNEGGEAKVVNGYRIALSLLTTSTRKEFVIHVSSNVAWTSFGPTPQEILGRLGFTGFRQCNILGGACYYKYYARSNTEAFQSGDILANQAIFLGFQRFVDNLPAIVDRMQEVDRQLQLAGFDVFPWQGVKMTPWDVKPGGKEAYFPAGTVHDAYKEIRQRIVDAQHEVWIEDNYVDSTLFDLLSNLLDSVRVRLLVQRYPRDFPLELEKFRQQHGVPVEVRTSATFHDRFIWVDDKCFHLGASIKDAGQKAFMLSQLEDPANVKAVRANLESDWEAGTPL